VGVVLLTVAVALLNVCVLAPDHSTLETLMGVDSAIVGLAGMAVILLGGIEDDS
jgi:hypothetical protein